jgi:DNA-binding SARP family transcriptional activator
MTTLHLHLFGSPYVELNGVRVDFGRRKAQALIAYLALSPNGRSRDFLAELLWPERDGPSARTDLRSGLFAIRQTIGDEWLETDGERVALRRAPGLDVDVLRFRDLLAGAAADPSAIRWDDACVATLAEAIALYTADFLAGFSLPDAVEFDNWQTYQTESLRLELAEALERLGCLHAERGDYATALGYARRWLELDPLCEAPHRALMRLYAAAGNRASSLRQYEECVRVLDQELGIKPDAETIALHEALAGRLPHTPGHAMPAPPPLVLPPDHTPFIGRKTEIAEIAERLADPACRLLTVLGPGGSGKTRLAVQAARAEAGHYADGIFFVDLQPVESVNLLAPAIALAVSAPTSGAGNFEESLIVHLQGRELLLVLDNFEHLMDGVDLLPRLLDAAPGLKLLITSRARLNLSAEWLLPLGGLALPPEMTRRVALEEYSASALFLACALRLQPDYRPPPPEVAEIAHVCRLLEGMPLGIELAAARVHMMPVRNIAAELTRGLDVLATTMRDAPARHRSMAAAFDASWRLLTPREQGILRRASVFRGGFTTDAAASVTDATAQDLDGLADSCWLRVEPGGRWGMHELIRQHCEAKLRTEHLSETGESEGEVRARLVAYFRSFVLERHAAFQGRPDALPEIEMEFGNLIVAWEGFTDPSDPALMRKVTAGFGLMSDRLVWWPVVLPLVEQNLRQFRKALVHGDHDPGRRRRLELALAWHLFLLTEGKLQLGRYGEAYTDLDEAEALLGDGDPEDINWAQTHYMIVRNRAWLDYHLGKRAAAQKGWLTTLAQLRAARFPVWVFPAHSSLLPQAEILLGLAWNALECGQYDRGLGWAREAVEMAQEFGSALYEALTASVLITCLTTRGRYAEAERVAKRALRTARTVHAPDTIIQCLASLASLYVNAGRPELARTWARRCVALCEETGCFESVLPWALTTLSLAELALGHIAEAHRHAQCSMEIVERSGGASISDYANAAVAVGRAALAEGKPGVALIWVRRALASRAKRSSALTTAAQLLADIRLAQGRQEDAAEIFASVAKSPRSWHGTQLKAANALSELESALPPDVYAAAVARGESRKIDELVTGILAEEPPEGHTQSPN